MRRPDLKYLRVAETSSTATLEINGDSSRHMKDGDYKARGVMNDGALAQGVEALRWINIVTLKLEILQVHLQTIRAG